MLLFSYKIVKIRKKVVRTSMFQTAAGSNSIDVIDNTGFFEVFIIVPIYKWMLNNYCQALSSICSVVE